MGSFLLRGDHNKHVHPFKLRPHFNRSILGKVLLKAGEQLNPEFFVRDLAAAKMNSRFDLVAVLKDPHGIILLEDVIVIVCAGPELYLLDGDIGLLGLGFLLLLLLLVLPFAEVNDAADRRLSLWRNFDEIKALAPREFQSLLRSHNAYLRPVLIYHANLAHANALVDANRRPAVSLISKTSSSLKAADGLSS